MTTDVEPTQTPEERELTKKLAEVGELKTALAEKELALATLHVDLRAFHARYIRIVGSRYAVLDEIAAQVAEATARRDRLDANAQARATQARAEAQRTAEAASAGQTSPQEERFAPSDRLKKLYREAAKRLHPDLAPNEQERSRRQHLMAEINQAYESGDEEHLRRVLRDWRDSPESVTGEGPTVELVRTIRKIAQVARRLKDIEAEIAALEESELHQLRTRTEEAERQGEDLLALMATELDERIKRAREQLAALTVGHPA
jgi:hypothetical protein